MPRKRLEGIVLFLTVTTLSLYCAVTTAQPQNSSPSPGLVEDGVVALGGRSNGQTVEIPFQTSFDRGEIYSFNCSIGTPPQQITIVINTGFGDTIINNSTLDVWTDDGHVVPKVFYKTGDSKTYISSIDTAEYSKYYDDVGNDPDPLNITRQTIQYSQDILVVGGISFQQFDFVSETSSNKSGKYSVDYWNSYFLGLGLPTNVAANWSIDEPGGHHNTILEAFVVQHYIQLPAYSIWLDPYEQQTGHLLLGGINTKRYMYPLTELDTGFFEAKAVSEILYRDQLTVGFKSVSFTTVDKDGSVQNSTNLSNLELEHSFGLNYRHDPFSYFPPLIVSDIEGILGAASPQDAEHGAKVPCSYLTNSSTFDFTFASTNSTNVTFHVPLSDLTLHTGAGPNLDEGPNSQDCQLAIKPTPPGLPNYLSTRMLKSLYLLFDLKNKIISAALTDFNATADNTISLPTGGLGAVPSAALGLGSPNQPTSTADANPQTGDTTNEFALRLSVGLAVPAVIALAILFFKLRWRHQDKKSAIREREREERERVEALRAEELANEVPVHQMPPSDSESEKVPQGNGHGGISELPGDSAYRVGGHGHGQGQGQAGIDAREIHELA